MDANDRIDILNLVQHALSHVNVTAPINTPAAPALPYPPPSRFKKFGGYYVCERCQLAQEFCGCAKVATADVQSSDDAKRADASLSQRVKDCMGGTP